MVVSGMQQGREFLVYLPSKLSTYSLFDQRFANVAMGGLQG